MKAFEKMEKREERRKEALQRINEKKESPETQPQRIPDDPVKDSHKQLAPLPQTKSKPQPQAKEALPAKQVPQKKASTSTPKVPACRRKRNRSGPVLRRRSESITATAAASEPPSDAELDDSGNTSGPGRGRGDSVVVQQACSRIPTPAEVGSTATGTLPSTSASAASFRFPKTKKVCSRATRS